MVVDTEYSTMIQPRDSSQWKDVHYLHVPKTEHSSSHARHGSQSTILFYL